MSLQLKRQLTMFLFHPIRGVDTLYDSLPPNKEGVADTGTTIGVALLSGFALMLLWVTIRGIIIFSPSDF